MTVENLTRLWLANRVTFFMQMTANSGISWGVDNPGPPGSLAAWYAQNGNFGGPVSGQTHRLDPQTLSAGDVDAGQAIAEINYMANAFAGIRRCRIMIYRTHFQLGTQLQYDNTAVGNTSYPAGDFASGAPKPGIGNQVTLSQSMIDASITNLINAYNAMCRNTTLTLTNTVCHVSCHSNCHCARGRR
jgi:hypothetical protein